MSKGELIDVLSKLAYGERKTVNLLHEVNLEILEDASETLMEEIWRRLKLNTEEVDET